MCDASALEPPSVTIQNRSYSHTSNIGLPIIILLHRHLPRVKIVPKSHCTSHNKDSYRKT